MSGNPIVLRKYLARDDQSGNLLLLGGDQRLIVGLNDLWRFEIEKGEWTWMAGNSSGGVIESIYGTLGEGNNSTRIGARDGVVNWVDDEGNLWLFSGSGYGHDRGPVGFGYLNDLWKISFSTITGLNTNEFVKNMIYPNPVSNTLSITIEEGAKVLEIIIHDLTGRSIKHIPNIDYQYKKLFKIDTSDLPSGIYILNIVSKFNVRTAKFQKR